MLKKFNNFRQKRKKTVLNNTTHTHESLMARLPGALVKASFAQVGIFSTLRLFASESFSNNKVGIRINYAHQVDTFKSFYNKGGLSFFDFQLFIFIKFLRQII